MPRKSKAKALAQHAAALPPGPPGQAPVAATGQPYGDAGVQRAMQAVMPLGTGTDAAAAPPVPGAAAAGPPPDDAALALAQSMPGPGEGLLMGDSRSPDEPITAGAPFGPGAGPDALRAGDPDLTSLRPYLPALELMASQPNASIATRNMVRRLRGAIPPGT